jgi:putative CocE/NonD family hydrolase
MKLFSILLSLAVISLLSGSARSQQSVRDYIKENYSKRELMIPMRDGVKLFTAIYEPKNRSEKHPVLLTRTPFSVAPYGADAFPGSLGPSELFAREGYIFVYQDVRGLWASEGEFVHVRPARKTSDGTDETTDAYDTVDWLVKNAENNNGRVGLYGVSYPGFFASAGIIDTHPAIKAASPQAPISDVFMGDDFRHNGALFLAQNFAFYTFYDDRSKLKPNDFSIFSPFELGTEDGYGFFLKLGGLKNAGDFYQTAMGRRSKYWDEAAAHPNYDQYWKDRNILPRLKNIKTPVLVTGGWFDNEDLYGALETYRHIRKQNPQTAAYLVMGPWAHNQWSRVDGYKLGAVDFGSKTAVDYRTKYELPFFNYYLKRKGDIAALKPVNVFDTGSMTWRTFDKYDPSAAVPASLYLTAGKGLSFKKPAGIGSDSYPSDPAAPVPFTQTRSPDYPREYMVEDQRFAAKRADVVAYQSGILKEDLTVAGDLRPELWVTTTGTDADFIVKLIDVRPDGYQMLLRGEPFPARFRNTFSVPEPMKPNAPTPISFTMPGVTHTFKKGHRIMVQIQSTWFPLVARNPQTFVPNYAVGTEKDFKKTTQKVFFGGMRTSRIVLPIVRK